MSNELINYKGAVDNLPTATIPDLCKLEAYTDEANRIFWVTDVIDAGILDLVKVLIRVNAEDKDVPVEERRPVKIFIDSPGGDVSALWTVVNAIKISKTPVWTINMCTAYSAAADLMTCGTRRFALPGTSFMFHGGSRHYEGQADDVETMKKFFDKVCKQLDDFVVGRTNISSKTYKAKTKSDWFFDEVEALNLGVIDAIVSDFNEIIG